MNGRDFINSLPEQPTEERDERIFEAITAGHHPPMVWRELHVEAASHTGIVRVMHLPLMVGDEDPVLVSVRHPTAQRLADHFKAVLITAKLSDQVWLSADHRLDPCLQTPDSHMATTRRMLEHHDCVMAALEQAGAGPEDMSAPVGKDWASTNRLIGRPDRSAEYGAQSPSARHQGVTPGVRVWQPGPSLAHVASFADYMTGKVRLVLRSMEVDGVAMDIRDVAADPILHPLVSSEGSIGSMRHPAVPDPEALPEVAPELAPADTRRPPMPLLTRTLRRGSYGDDVAIWQRIIGATSDGVFGPVTAAATSLWQRARSLTADGIVGPRTRRRALAEIHGDGPIAPPPGSIAPPPGTVLAEPAVLDVAFVQAENFRWADRQLVHWIVMHSMEAPEKPSTAEAVARWFAGLSGTAPRSSAHYCIDNDSVVCCVKEEHVAWHAKRANRFGVGYEHAGYARQSREEWLDDYSESMLHNSARLAAQVTIPRWDLPVHFVDRDGLRRAYSDFIDRGLPVPDELRGFTTHLEVTHGLGGSHVDPGKHFPMDVYLDMVREAA